MGIQRKIGGGFLVVAGSAFAKETFSWVYENVLDLLTAGMGKTVTWATFPWLNALGVVAFVSGLVVLTWPWLSAPFRAKSAESEIDAAIAAAHYDDSELRGLFSTLRAEVAAIGVEARRNSDERKSELAALDLKSARIAAIVDQWHTEELTEKAKPVIAHLRDFLEGRRGSTDMGPGLELMGYEVSARDSEAMVCRIGLDRSKVGGAVATVANAVEADPLHLTRNDREKAQFLFRAKIAALLKASENPTDYI